MSSTTLFIDAIPALLEPLPKGRYLPTPGSITALKQISASGTQITILLPEDLKEGEIKEAEFCLSLYRGEGVSFETAEGIPLDKFSENSSTFVTATKPEVEILSLFKEENIKMILLSGSKEKSSKKTKWGDVTKIFSTPARVATVIRNTNETTISVMLNLDGNGKYKISTGLSFFDHMLEQLSRHSEIDMEIKIKGDLHVDEHHTVEDAAIAIGEALKKALGDKRGIARYGFMLPMDESLATCALDFSGRAELVFNANFKREKVGDLPTELVRHFFYSFCINAGLNMHLTLIGENEHHMIEAAFKVVAKSIGQAVKRVGNELPTTKGTL